MARHNRVTLSGYIEKYSQSKENDENGKEVIVEVSIALLVLRRPSIALGNKRGDLQFDSVVIIVKNRNQIKYLTENKVLKGDFLEVTGIYCTVNSEKTFHCTECEEENSYEGTSSFVYPLFISLLDRVEEKEIVAISKLERETCDTKTLIELVNKKRKNSGIVTGRKDKGFKDDKCYIEVTSRKKFTDVEIVKWLQEHVEVSNYICLIGNVCSEPIYYESENKDVKTCSYQIGINRNVFIRYDDINKNADFPWIKTMGKQAELDHQVLKVGSLVQIEGAIQVKSDILEVKDLNRRKMIRKSKTCEYCGAVNKVKDFAMEIIPYNVEYLKDCNQIINNDEQDSDIAEPYDKEILDAKLLAEQNSYYEDDNFGNMNGYSNAFDESRW